MKRSGVAKRLFMGFAMQAAAISVAALLGVLGSAKVITDVLIQKALTDEAALYAQRLAADPHAAAPDTVNLKGYFKSGPEDQIPPYLLPLGEGFHDLNQEAGGDIAYVEKRESGTLYLVFAEENVLSLALFFGLVPLVVVLLTVYLITWLTYRMSHRAVSPLVRLARRVENLDLNRLNSEDFDPEQFSKTDDEVYILVNALSHLDQRIQRFVERERNFTRDASHELRSPVTVIQMAADMLVQEGKLGDYETKTINRIRNVSRDMQALIEALLVLARESGEGLAVQEMSVNDVVDDEFQRYEFLVRGKKVRLKKSDLVDMRIVGPRSVLSVMVGNLIRNACNYTNEGDVAITVGKGYVSVDDTGVGMSEEAVANAFEPFYRGGRTGKGGHGVGLTIVKRLSDRFGWPVEIKSEINVGTCATIYFPQYEISGEPEPAKLANATAAAAGE
ncbi:MAG: HAMP domain-containing sensor histidine kinase [Xanthomonadales bacterium]|nr:HAMP domain-containing sensor histidine kinase [Xanthomonadales bacterium]